MEIMSLIGTLEEIQLAEVLRLFASGKKNGLLTVASGDSGAQLRFSKGSLVSASTGGLQGDDAVLDLFGWKEGQITFVPDDRLVAPNVTRDVDALILEGLRVGESFHKTRSLVPSDHVTFQMTPAPPEGGQLTVGATEWKVLSLLDGIRDVREIVEASRLPRPAVLEVIVQMAEAGFLERVEVQKSLRAQSGGRFAKETATVDERLEGDWKRITRLAHGVLRLEIRSLAGRRVTLPVDYRAGLIRDVHLPRAILSELHVREGEDVKVRPVA